MNAKEDLILIMLNTEQYIIGKVDEVDEVWVGLQFPFEVVEKDGEIMMLPFGHAANELLFQPDIPLMFSMNYVVSLGSPTHILRRLYVAVLVKLGILTEDAQANTEPVESMSNEVAKVIHFPKNKEGL